MTDLPDIDDFWQWALQRWSKPGLAAALLPLQDQVPGIEQSGEQQGGYADHCFIAHLFKRSLLPS